jgi:hypothetical protein
MALLPLDTSVEGVYADGFVLSETELNDVSPYNSEQNVLRAIINKDPEAEHGPLVLFSVFYNNARYDIDWTVLPDNARPIRFRDGNMSQNVDTGETSKWWSGCRMGYQFNDESGKNVQEVQELK